MEKKIIKKDRFNQLLGIAGVAENEELVAFIKHEIELLEKKGSKSGATKTQKENEEIMATLYTELYATGKALTISEFQKVSEYASQFSNQKVSALFKTMTEKLGTVEKTVEKGKSYFKAI